MKEWEERWDYMHPEEPDNWNEALHLVHGVFPASNFSWNSSEHVCTIFPMLLPYAMCMFSRITF